MESANFWQWRPDTWLHKRLAEKRDELKATSKTDERVRELSSRTPQKPEHDRRNCERCSKPFKSEHMARLTNWPKIQSPKGISGKPARDRDSN